MERYVKQVLTRYKDDPRILAWCLYNEPENTKGFDTLPFLETVFRWAREVNPSQPLTAPMWATPDSRSYNRPISEFVCANSDVISFHCYENVKKCRRFIRYARRFHRPVLCSEWMARSRGSGLFLHPASLQKVPDRLLQLRAGERKTAVPLPLESGRRREARPLHGRARSMVPRPVPSGRDAL